MVSGRASRLCTVLLASAVLAVILIPAGELSGAQLTSVNVPPGTPDDWKLTGSGAPASKLVAAAQKYQGVLPIEIDYNFKKTRMNMFFERSIAMPGQPKKISANIYGDKSDAVCA